MKINSKLLVATLSIVIGLGVNGAFASPSPHAVKPTILAEGFSMQQAGEGAAATATKGQKATKKTKATIGAAGQAQKKLLSGGSKTHK